MTTSGPASIEMKHGSGVYAKRGLTIVRGEGIHVWDDAGRRYIDCTGGHGVAALGHCHPAVVTALTAQAGTLMTCPEAFFNDRRAGLLERLSKLLPGGMDRFFLCNSGTEAVEAAIKFARASTGRHEIVAAKRGFHGRTLGALSATWEQKYRTPFEPLVPGFHHAAFNDLEAFNRIVGGKTAAVLVEIVQGEGGVRPGTPEFLRGLECLCREQGALLIVDEIQTGFGRTGRWFASEHHDLLPDLLCMGKAIAGGMPMAAVALGSRVGPLRPGLHGSTFGGNPLACAVALATINTLERERLIDRSAKSGNAMIARLRRMDSPLIREVRGAGLMIGVDLRIRVTPLLKSLAAAGVLALPAGPTVLRLLPPLTIDDEAMDTVAAEIEVALISQK